MAGTLYAYALIIYMLWLISSLVISILIKSFDVSDDNKLLLTAKTIYFELKPFILPMIVVMYLTYHGTMSGRIADTVINAFIWWSYKDLNDDDRWKKRLKRLKDKVQVSGSKLVVVPESA